MVQKQSVADNDRNDGPGSPRGWSASLKAAGAQARIQDLTAGLLLALVTFAYSVSFGALIFSGRLAEYSGLGVVSALLSAALATLVIARFSSFRHALAGPDTPVAAILSALAIGVAGVSPVEASAGQVLANVVMALIICSVITACLLTAVGVFRLSKWMRFIPYTVVAGFLAASGWFLIDGAAIMMVGEPMHDALPLVLEQGVWHSPLIAAALFGAGIWGLQVITKSPLAAPFGALALWLGVELAGVLGIIDHAVLERSGWSLAELPDAHMRIAVQALAANAPDFSALSGFIPEIISVAGVAALAILLNASGLEVDARAEADLDREYVASGIANFGVAAIGGLPSNISLNRSIMNQQAGAQSRFAGVVVGLGCIAGAFFAADTAAAVPGPVLGGLVLYMGASMLWRWLVAGARRFNRPELLSVFAIFGLIVSYGYIAGAALGIVASCITFAITYSRAAFVRQRLSRRQYSSYVLRAPADQQLLAEHGDRIQIFQLQGYIFFGTAHQLGLQVQRAIEAAREPITHLILDFRRVTGADSSASFSLVKILQVLHRHQVHPCFTSLTAAQAERLRSMVEDEYDVDPPAIFDSLDYGLEWCEERVLADLGGDNNRQESARHWLARELRRKDLADRLIGVMKRQHVKPGEMICRQGEPSDVMLFVVRGRVSIMLERPGEADLRLRSMLEKTVIGEIGFYKGGARSASVIADRDSEVLLLDRVTFNRLRQEDSETADALHRLVIRVLADRLTFASNEIAALHD